MTDIYVNNLNKILSDNVVLPVLLARLVPLAKLQFCHM